MFYLFGVSAVGEMCTSSFWHDLAVMCLEHTIGSIVTFVVFCMLLLIFPSFRQVLFSRLRRFQR